MSPKLWLPALALVFDVCTANQAIWLTSIQPFTGADWDAGISMRLGGQIMQEEVNANPNLLPGYELKIAWQDGLCSKGVGTQLFLENIFDRKYTVFAPGKTLAELDADGSGTVTTSDTAPMGQIWDSTQVSPHPVGLLGSGCAGTALNIANIGYMARFPMVSNSATRPALSDRSTYPNFFRTIMPDTFFNDAWIGMARQLNQTGVGVVIGEIENWGSMGSTLANAALSQGVQLIGNDLTQDVANFYGMKVSLDSQSLAKAAANDLVKYKPRVIILLMFHRRNRLVLCEAFKNAYFNAVYMPMGWLPFGWWSRPDTDCTPESLTGMAKYFISANMMFWRADSNTRLSCSTSMTSKQFQDEWFRRQGGTPGDLSMRPEGYAPATEAATTGDAVCMYAQALHEVLINRGVPLSDLTDRTANGYSNIIDVLSNTNFEGVQGTVRFLPGVADPLGSVILQQLQETSSGSLTLLDAASYKHPVVTYLGLGTLKFQFPGESFVAGPTGATSINAHLTSFKVCVNKVLDMRTNQCMDCPPNTQYVQTAGACLCVAGYYETSGGCAPCAPGTISTAPGTISCTACGIGKYAPGAGTSCPFCPRGRYADSSGMGQCTACPTRYTTEAIASESVAQCVCDVTSFWNGNDCEKCPQNSQTDGSLNSSSITSCLCADNYYMENSICKQCPTGSTTDGGGKLSITDCNCDRDLYRSNGVCQACPKDSLTIGTGKTHVKSCLCPEGKYMPTDTSECKDCPKGMECPKGANVANAAFITSRRKSPEQEFLKLAPRYWASLEEPMSILECRSLEKCPGDRYPGNACEDNLISRACEHCMVGTYWTGTKCAECSAVEATVFIFPILPMMFAPFILIGMYKMFGDTFVKWSTWRNGCASLGFIVLNFYQTVDIVRSANIQLPPVTVDMFSTWSFTNDLAAIFKLDCVGVADFKASIIMRGCIPPIMGVYAIIVFVCSWLVSKQTKIPWLFMDRDRLLNVFGSLMFTFFNTIAAVCLLLFQCSENPNGSQSLGIDLSIICWDSADWQSMLAVSMVFVLVYIIGMGGLFVRTVIVAPKYFHCPGFQMRWKFLFIKFRSDVHWWSIVFLLKNFLTNLSFVITASGIIQLYLSMLMSTLYMCAVVMMTPFRHRVVNALDIVASLCTLYVASLLTWFAERTESAIDDAVDVSIGLVSLMPAVVGIGCVAHLYRYGYNMPPSERELLVAETEFEDVNRCFAELSHLDTKAGSSLMLEIGEWDRRYLLLASHAIKVDIFEHNTAARVANSALGSRVSKAISTKKSTSNQNVQPEEVAEAPRGSQWMVV